MNIIKFILFMILTISLLHGESYRFTASIDQDFCGSRVIVAMERGTGGINRTHSESFFGEIEIVSVTDLTEITGCPRILRINEETFTQILLLELPIDDKQNVLDVIERLHTIEGIKFAEPNFNLNINRMIPDDPDFLNGRLWGMERIRAVRAWEYSIGSLDVRVGIMDTGMIAHPDLIGNLVEGWNFLNNNDNTHDSHGHGTHVAGTVGAVGNNGIGVVGVNWDVSLVPLRIGPGPEIDVYAALVAVTYAINNDIHVLNYSVTGFGVTQGNSMRHQIANYPGFFVWAAGNEGQNHDGTLAHLFQADNLLSVGAINVNDARSVWGSQSSSAFGSHVNIFAPGSSIRSTWRDNDYSNLGGTSMAAPHVAGVAALLLAIDPLLTPLEIKTAILKGADTIAISTPAGLQNTLRLNAFGAVQNLNFNRPHSIKSWVSDQDIFLEWEQPRCVENFLGYRIFRISGVNGVELTDWIFDDTFFLDENVPIGIHVYQVIAVFENETSDPTSLTVALGFHQFGEGERQQLHNHAGPVNISSRSVRSQFVLTTEELNEIGLVGSQELTHFAFYVTDAPLHPLPQYSIRITHTTFADASTHEFGPWENTTTIQSLILDSNTWNHFKLTEPFIWNGEQNILFDVSFEPVPEADDSGQIRVVSANNGFRYIRANTSIVDIPTSMIHDFKPQMLIGTPQSLGLLPPKITSADVSGNDVILRWESTASTQNMHNIYRDGVFIASTPINIYTFTVENILNGEYIFSISAVNQMGESSWVSTSVVVNASIQITPNSMEFGTVGIGYNSNPKTFTLKNTSENSLSITNISIDDENFELVDGIRYPVVITVGEEQSFDVVFSPVKAGLNEVSLVITYDPSSAVRNIRLKGNGFELVPPRNLRYEIDEYDVTIRWSLPNANAQNFNGFIVYRDETRLTSQPINDLFYLDKSREPGKYMYSVFAVYVYGTSQPSYLEVEVEPVSDAEHLNDVGITRLIGNFPNPFNPVTSIRYQVSGIEGEFVNISVFNIRGQRVRTLVNEYVSAGFHNVDWNGTDDNNQSVSSGIYLYKMETGDYQEIRRMVLLK